MPYSAITQNSNSIASTGFEVVTGEARPNISFFDAPAKVVGEINKSFQTAINKRKLFIGNGGEVSYVSILTDVQKSLGTKIDFGNQEHREAIGEALVATSRGRER